MQAPSSVTTWTWTSGNTASCVRLTAQSLHSIRQERRARRLPFAAIGITSGGVIMGSYVDLAGGHGYLRTPDGRFQTFDVPGSNNSTDPQATNAASSVTGVYSGSGGMFHGFLRQTNGIYTTFDPPSSVYTWPTDISTPGTIVGFYLESDPGLIIGFVRTTNWNITPFNAPNGGFLNTYPTIPLNAQGMVAGSFCSDAQCDVIHGFLRTSDGTMTVFDVPGDNDSTGPDAINSAGDTTGWNITSDFSALHGFVRSHNGTFVTIDPPGSGFTIRSQSTTRARSRATSAIQR